ncbi:MepB family protein [Xenorhabdus littoralis]|uniref:MepB family protein n=1 Tax=Xenorhabdus littoralis TaxID=2582835 RepID=UPI0029E81964|nr:MepB family protein [Xenorhabdus sp. psl]
MSSLKSDNYAASPNTANLPSIFTEIQEYLLLSSGLQLDTPPYREAESRDYSAMRFTLNGKSIVFRQAKTTPNKPGQFVTLWKRPTSDSDIMPLEQSDNIDFCLIATFSENQKGIFLFDSHILIKKGIFSTQSKEGKRAIRVYPTWVSPTSRQAIQTQKWLSDCSTKNNTAI